MKAECLSENCLPRIIAVRVKKPSESCSRYVCDKSKDKPRISGYLQVRYNESDPEEWCLSYAEVKGGSLCLFRCENEIADYRIKLRSLNLRCVGKLVHIYKKEASCPEITLLMNDEWDRRRWIKYLSAEIITQTPLSDVKFLDIFGPASSFESNAQKPETSLHKAPEPEGQELIRTENPVLKTRFSKNCKISSQHCRKHDTVSSDDHKYVRRSFSLNQQPDLTLMIMGSKYRSRRARNLPDVLQDLPFNTISETVSSNSPTNLPELNHITELLGRCQSGYVPVKEKAVLFESLSRFSYSVDNLIRNKENLTPSYRSLCDLNHINLIPVKDMCKYFEMFAKQKSTSSFCLTS